MSDAPDDEIQVISATYGAGENPRDWSLTFALNNVHLMSRQVPAEAIGSGL